VGVNTAKKMSKKQTLRALNDAIDKLIIKGLKSPAQKKEFRRLCDLHTVLVREMPPVK
jgi:hypothetical protein